MEIKGFNTECKNDAMALAMKKVNRKLRINRRARWPRCKGPRALRVEVTTGFLVGVIA